MPTKKGTIQDLVGTEDFKKEVFAFFIDKH